MRNEVLSIKRKATIIITMVVMFVVALMGSTSFVSAGEYSSASKTASQLGHKYFKDDWKDYGTFKIKNVVYEFTYGYDTCLINEDYIDDVFSQSKKTTYYGKVRNSKGTTAVTNKKSDRKKTGIAEVKHTGAKVTYYVYAKKN